MINESCTQNKLPNETWKGTQGVLLDGVRRGHLTRVRGSCVYSTVELVKCSPCYIKHGIHMTKFNRASRHENTCNVEYEYLVLVLLLFTFTQDVNIE